MSNSQETSDWKKSMHSLERYLVGRYKKSGDFPSIRRAVQDAQKQLDIWKQKEIKNFTLYAIVGILALFVFPWLLIGILIYVWIWRKEPGNRILWMAYIAPINAQTEQKLGTLLNPGSKLHTPSASRSRKKQDDYSPSNSEKNPWIQ